MNKLHKDAIYKLSLPHISTNEVISVLLELLSSTNKSKDVQIDWTQIENLKEEIMRLESKLMVLDKIVEQTDNDEKENYHLLVEDFNNMR